MIRITTVIFGDALTNGYATSQSAFDAAFYEAQSLYPDLVRNVSRHTLYRAGTFVCQNQETAAVMPIAAMEVQSAMPRNDRSLNILINTGCTFETAVLADFAREWNIPVFASVASGAGLTNADRYPTLISAPSTDINSLVSATIQLLQLYNWTTLSLLCDDLTPNTIDGFSASTCRTCIATFAAEKRFRVTVQHFDATAEKPNQTDDYRAMLYRTKSESRVILLVAGTKSIVRVLAHRLEMSAGDYVFLVLVSPETPGLQSIRWQYFDENDQAALETFKSVIIISNRNTNWDRIPDLLPSIRNRSEIVYNRSRSVEEFNVASDYVVAAYELFAMLMKVLNQSQNELDRLDGKSLRKKFLKKTFALPSRSVSIGDGGMRLCDITLSKWNFTSERMQITWTFNSIARTLVQSSVSVQWIGGKGPPAHQPSCGYVGDQCIVTSCKGLFRRFFKILTNRN
ncbi:hypothetical protein BV898_14714 [Hypsibius exemplaris]|uniref:Receptor ligand binding region domain-containing protein n=1 Tax=Hypsibius exemplaris TaxID=2072580 RepID=A0A9X6NAR8_HYPEX|nr:hypothetical protein BV898_14714 [Hypsibius exemplaris]